MKLKRTKRNADANHSLLRSWGYTSSPDTYDRGRPEYSAEANSWLSADLGLHGGQTVLDLGAGTGKFTKRLIATGAKVCAVDPIPAMLERLTRQHVDLDVRTGSAEAIPFGDASFDVVVCAQSFHWFVAEEAIGEIRRVLKPGGRLGLIWNVRDERIEWVAALTRIIKPYEGETPRYGTQRWRTAFPAEGFTPLREHNFSYRHRGSPERVIVDRILSVSFIAALDTEARHRVATQIRELIAKTPQLAGRAEVDFPYETAVLNCTKRVDKTRISKRLVRCRETYFRECHRIALQALEFGVKRWEQTQITRRAARKRSSSAYN